MTQIMHKKMLDFRKAGDELLLDYELRTEKCSWSIFDTGGMELCSGMLNGQPPHRIPVASLSPNLYQLCVIDGDMLLNTRFRID